MILDLTDEEAKALAKHLRDTIDYARYPFAPRLDPLKAILAKLEPPAPRPEPPPPLTAGAAPSVGRGRRRRWGRYRGPPMTLGNAATASARLLVWRPDCRLTEPAQPSGDGQVLRRRDERPGLVPASGLRMARLAARRYGGDRDGVTLGRTRSSESLRDRGNAGRLVASPRAARIDLLIVARAPRHLTPRLASASASPRGISRLR